MITERWENGSSFAYPEQLGDVKARWLPAGSTFWHSGRDAVRALITSAPKQFRRLLVPSYYCQEVGLAIQIDGTEVYAYPDDPRITSIPTDCLDLRTGDGIIVSNTYGLRNHSPLIGDVPEGVSVIEDHTHDPASGWALTTNAPFAFASLRKWLPIPDGAALWSGSDSLLPLPPGLGSDHATGELARLSGMLLKSRYLNGEGVQKQIYRTLSVEGEAVVGLGVPVGMSPLSQALVELFPIQTWRAKRRANYDLLVSLLADLTIDGLDFMRAPDGACPFAFTLVAPDPGWRERWLALLIQESIYPAVLWPVAKDPMNRIPGITDNDAALSTNVLSIHCDHRYSSSDMLRVGDAVRRTFLELAG